MKFYLLSIRRICLTFFYCFACTFGYGATIIVVSNADSGPGTLRDALSRAAANGTAEKDYIYFNLTDLSPGGRTINLTSQLPDLSSNLVIDATTQAGATFGQNNAHVKIATPDDESDNIIFNGVNLNDVEFYGFYLSDFSTNTFLPNSGSRTAIAITQSKNITIGEAGKGNLINGFNLYSIAINQCDSVTMQGNTIGLDENNEIGQSLPPPCYFFSCNNILVGGATLTEGNVFFTELNFDFAQNATGLKFSIESNSFGIFKITSTNETVNAGLNQAVNIGTFEIPEYGLTSQQLAASATVVCNIENNVASSTGNVFRINALNGLIDLTKNYFGIDRDGVTPINITHETAYESTPVYIENCAAQVNLGAADSTLANVVGYSFSVMYAANSANIFVRNNIYQCIQNTPYLNDNVNNELPRVTITAAIATANQTKAAGTADPNATIDIYSSESCTYSQCSIRKLLQTVISDNAGKWTSNIFNLTGIFYVSSSINSRTSEFATVQINSDSVKITNLRCDSTASITGLQVPQGTTYQWIDQNGNIVSDSLNLIVHKAGKYQLILAGGCITSNIYEIDNEQLALDTSSKMITEPSCGLYNGSIQDIIVYDPENMIISTRWIDANNHLVSGGLNALNLPPGSYTLKVSTSDGCEKDYGPVILKNTSGPVIDQSHAKIQSTNCGQTTGSVTNLVITGTGVLTYSWLNNQQQVVSNDSILTNQSAGTYRLEVTDDSPCGPVYSADFVIPETNGITIDEANVATTPSSCGIGSGTVTGIIVTGATQYQWTDASGNVISTTLNLTGVSTGTYTLTASNATGCSKTSHAYSVTALPATIYPAYPYNIKNTCAGSPEGSVSVTITDNLVAGFTWYNSQGNIVGMGSSITGMPAGNYSLYLTDKNGCVTAYNIYTISNIVPVSIESGSAVITNDQCNQKVGSITGIKTANGEQPYIYAWTDDSGNIISSNSAVENLGAGSYTLTVTDASGCQNATAVYTIQNNNGIVPNPSVNNVQTCTSGNVLIAVNNPSENATYNLYSSQSSSTPLEQSKSGAFKVDLTSNTTLYITQVMGTCESSRTSVSVTIGLSALNIANTFTPNGDGINDYWKINNIENYPRALVQVFTRNGQKVFESRGYEVPFDGTYKGHQLPNGVYYFIINLDADCNLISGSLTILR